MIMTGVFSSPYLFAGPELSDMNTSGADFNQFKQVEKFKFEWLCSVKKI